MAISRVIKIRSSIEMSFYFHCNLNLNDKWGIKSQGDDNQKWLLMALSRRLKVAVEERRLIEVRD